MPKINEQPCETFYDEKKTFFRQKYPKFDVLWPSYSFCSALFFT